MKKDQLEVLYRAYPFLKDLNKKSNAKLEEEIVFKKLSRGEFLKSTANNCRGFILIIRGKMKIERVDEEGRQTSLYEIGVGELCHESLSCYLECESLNTVAYALVDSEITILPMQMIKKYLLDDPNFWEYMYTNLYHKFRNLIINKEEMIYQPMQERLLKLLKNKGTSNIYMTHQEIALELGTAREVVSRKLKGLEKEGILRLERGKIKLI